MITKIRFKPFLIFKFLKEQKFSTLEKNTCNQILFSQGDYIEEIDRMSQVFET